MPTHTDTHLHTEGCADLQTVSTVLWGVFKSTSLRGTISEFWVFFSTALQLRLDVRMINVTYEVTALSAFDYRASLFLCSAASNHEEKCRSQHFSCILVIREMFPKVVCNSFQFYIYRGSACKLQCIAFGYFGPVVWPQFFYLINFFFFFTENMTLQWIVSFSRC